MHHGDGALVGFGGPARRPRHVFCFDTRRENEAVDLEHGLGAAAFAAGLRAEGVLPLGDQAFADLNGALRLHSEGRVSADPTIGTCWDADRLHLLVCRSCPTQSSSGRELLEPPSGRRRRSASEGRPAGMGRAHRPRLTASPHHTAGTESAQTRHTFGFRLSAWPTITPSTT